MHRRPPQLASKTGQPPAKHFDRLLKDVFSMQLTIGRGAVLQMVVVTTRFGSRVLKEERTADVIRELERAWIRPCGPPKRLQFDEARCFCFHEVTVFLEHDGVELDVASGGDH